MDANVFALKTYTREVDTAAAAATSQKNDAQGMNGFTRIERCRLGLECMDRQGWLRSFFQRKFHEAFLQATARVFWKVRHCPLLPPVSCHVFMRN